VERETGREVELDADRVTVQEIESFLQQMLDQKPAQVSGAGDDAAAES
jgi:hypothetical protein